MRPGKVISTLAAMAALGMGSVSVAQAGGSAEPAKSYVVTVPVATKTPAQQAPHEVNMGGLAPLVTTSATPEGGWRPAFDDGRLNPYRGPRADYGELQMGKRWNNQTPMEMIATPQRSAR